MLYILVLLSHVYRMYFFLQMIIFPNFMGTLCNKDADYEKECVGKPVFEVKKFFKRNLAPRGWTRLSSPATRWRQQCDACCSAGIISGTSEDQPVL